MSNKAPNVKGVTDVPEEKVNGTFSHIRNYYYFSFFLSFGFHFPSVLLS